MKVAVGQTRQWHDPERNTWGPFVIVCIDGNMCWLRYGEGRHTSRENVRVKIVEKGSS